MFFVESFLFLFFIHEVNVWKWIAFTSCLILRMRYSISLKKSNKQKTSLLTLMSSKQQYPLQFTVKSARTTRCGKTWLPKVYGVVKPNVAHHSEQSLLVTTEDTVIVMGKPFQPITSPIVPVSFSSSFKEPV